MDVALPFAGCLPRLPVLAGPLAFLLAAMPVSVARGADGEVTITVREDGSFDPPAAEIRSGGTVTWRFADRPDTTIIPLAAAAAARSTTPVAVRGCEVGPHDPADPNAFTGPMPEAQSGVFTIGPDGPGEDAPGYEVVDAASCDRCEATAGDECLCATGEDFATMDWTWAQPDITGVLIRLRWNEIQPRCPHQFDFTALDREIGQAVRHGKLYSLSIKAGHRGTPDWIFDGGLANNCASPGFRVQPLRFEDAGDDPAPGSCGTEMVLGGPADGAYRYYHGVMLTAVAEHIKNRADWYRALAYMKPSGMNLFSAENRLPNRCEDGPTANAGQPGAGQCTCNTQVWAEAGNYRPTALYDFYTEQFDLLGTLMPEKDQSYMLIQNGFPIISEAGDYPEQRATPEETLPGGDDQTQAVIRIGHRERGARFAVQHNGLQACPPTGECRAPNYIVRNQGELDWVTGLQTTNAGPPRDNCSDPTRVCDPDSLNSALQNAALQAPDVVFVEIYEERFWEEKMRVGDRYPPESGKLTVGQWDAFYHDRQQRLFPSMPDPEPTEHAHTFTRTEPGTGPQAFRYANGATCGASLQRLPSTASISIMPAFVTATSASVTAASGTSTSIDLPKVEGDTTHSFTHRTQDARAGLRSVELGIAAGRPCSLGLGFQDLPGQPDIATSASGFATWSGPVCAATSTGTAELAGPQLFVRGLRVCSGDGPLPQVKGVEIFSARVNDDGSVTDAAPTRRATLAGCSRWQPARYCQAGRVAVGVKTYFTERDGYTGLALECKAVELDEPA